MAYAVDWEIASTPDIEVVRCGPETEASELGALGGVCSTPSGALVLTEPVADRARWNESGRAVVLIGALSGLADGPATKARLRSPSGVAAAPDGSVVVADTDNHAIRRIGADGRVTTIAGGLYGNVDGPGAQARFRYPKGVAVAPDGTIVVADTGNDSVRRIDVRGDVTTLAGGTYGHGDLSRGQLGLRRPEAVAVSADGTVYVGDTGNDRVCAIGPDGRARLVAGRGGKVGSPAPAAGMRWPTGLAIAPDGTIYVTDAARRAVWCIANDGAADLLPGEPTWRPVALCLSADGTLLVAETHWSPEGTSGRLRTVLEPGHEPSREMAQYAHSI
jgi:DNA-binding beta-propeller fold protein YncE